jgi:hypothetical protein
MTNNQTDTLQKEIDQTHDLLQQCNENFTVQFCTNLRSIKAPSSLICEISDKFLLILDIKDRSWKNFKRLTKNLVSFKSLVLFAQSQFLTDSIINEILPLWKVQSLYRAKLINFPSYHVLLDWIGLIVELNLKKEMVFSSMKRAPELEKSIKIKEKTICSLKTEAKIAEKSYFELKKKIKESEIEDCSESSHTSKHFAFQSDQERVDKHIYVSAVNKGTASGGLMQKMPMSSLEKSMIPSISPNFSSINLYGEIPVHRDYEDKIVYEGRAETVGCCSIRFLCF